ncbi:MAG TPA: lipopolysaccharide heptosyltransferase II [Bacteroidota bacterium]|nr:lipopolysaccharide heptosyltransferase II [Bacteroidota bacterium]
MPPRKVLILQTAFLGDVVLTLPLVQRLHKVFPEAEIDFVATPRGAQVLRNHPAIRSIIEYDKRGRQRGYAPIISLSRMLKKGGYDVAIVPHRSIRSAVLIALSRIPIRIGFDTSAGSILFSHLVPYRKDIHEIERNLSLLSPLGIGEGEREVPSMYPSQNDAEAVDRFFVASGIAPGEKLIALAPGSVWATKRWLPDRFAELAGEFVARGYKVVCVGGKEDAELASAIAGKGGNRWVISAAGRFSILESAELLRRSSLLVTNDTAPMHLAVAMKVPVVAVFGATVPAFGFGPYGSADVVVESEGLSCRPCSIHGGSQCPIGTFDCMKNVRTTDVAAAAARLLAG